MRLFSDLHDEELGKIFYKQPVDFNKRSDKDQLAYALGATLYMPATRPNIHQDLLSKKHSGLTSMVICLEDAIGDWEVERAEKLVVEELLRLQEDMKKGFIQEDDLPLLFIRIRSYEQLLRLINQAEQALSLLTGIVIPKFNPVNGTEIINEIQMLHQRENFKLYVMPILETREIIYKETRLDELLKIKAVLDEFSDYVLNVRIGATDFCGLFGIRRNTDTTIYDIAIMRDCITDILNIFSRSDSPYLVSGPVWEHFSSKERRLKPQLRQTPFRQRYGQKGLELRTDLIDQQMDGLIREVLMDISNGIIGKTIIHPTHIKAVQALNTVSCEEYLDAKMILEQADGQKGVLKSSYSNKMNEIKPHYYWAEKTIKKSLIYGVLHEDYTYIDILESTIHAKHSESVKY
ncbi:HpcH/HpaI aldolase/citrate lyase family protein [Cytobacillus gottheilii]|uniref:HpcH/HpaI aldolase/citrate lyase family protein n=1 Tax=Cytobacillus gottheilii TaxID=859144 RepID=A0ABX8F951_9BACI|nr:HpcH/HpaI aldolase/citrate lyase family protein [Cytobacillus gottheilii]QVY60077.1 HpcH/HpaI aldolase/citrate lyase family protein [Cytobacillus gottheilii]